MSVSWLNGQLVPSGAVPLPAAARGVAVGLGVFETMATRHGRVFAASLHLARLRASCAALSLRAPSADDFTTALSAVRSANDLPEARLRFTVLGGAIDGNDLWLATADPLVAYPASARVTVVSWRRNARGPLSGHKSVAWAENALALAEARRRGADEAIFLNTDGVVCEGATSNVFLVASDGTLVTPPLRSGCLPGIARALVLGFARDAGLAVLERDVTVAELAQAREMFLTSSLRGVQAVTSCDGIDFAVGKTTTSLAATWRAASRA